MQQAAGVSYGPSHLAAIPLEEARGHTTPKPPTSSPIQIKRLPAELRCISSGVSHPVVLTAPPANTTQLPRPTWWNAAGVSASVKSVGSNVSPLSSAYSSSPSVVAAAHDAPVGLRASARVWADGRLRVDVPGTSAAAAGSPPGGSNSSSESGRGGRGTHMAV